jgi:hypothetical protein
MLKQRLPGVRIGRGFEPVSVVAYADVTVFLTSVTEFSTVQEAIQLFKGLLVHALIPASPGPSPSDDGLPPTTPLASHTATTRGYWVSTSGALYDRTSPPRAPNLSDW